MLLTLWAPWTLKAHESDSGSPGGREFNTWVLLPGSHAMEWAEGINLPGVAVVTPLEFAFRQPGELPNYRINFFGWWLVGLLCWWMTGRFADEVVRWRKSRMLHSARRAEVTFALIVFPSAILLASAFGFSGAESRVVSMWAIFWIAITSACFLFRVAQLIKHRRRMPAR
jgi:hypothetical protein